jgi:hypothetical protein
MTRACDINTTELGRDEWWMNPRVRNFPVILADGRYNIGSPDAWLATGGTQPGPTSGRPPLLFGDATADDLLRQVRVLKAFAVEIGCGQ